MQVIKTRSELKAEISRLRAVGKKIGFVPTMGALHEGHLSLIDIARSNADVVVTSIFVNQAQFAPNEDFDKYPRQEQSDLEKISAKNIEIAYLPSASEIYAEGFSLGISVGAIGKELEGVSRPHFFDGVALVVTKLFMQVLPDIAVFGEKDYQQLIVIKKLVKELDIPVQIIGAPICREEDGLAMSSRNVYLVKGQRQIAANLYRVLCLVKEKILAGEDVEKTLLYGKEELQNSGFEQVDYLELRHAETLQPLTSLEKPTRLLAVARIGGVRLLDNLGLR